MGYAARCAISLVICMATVFGAGSLLSHRLPQFWGAFVVTAVFLAAYLACVRWIERRRAEEFALRPALAELSIGLALGAGLFATVMAVLWGVGAFRPAGWTPAAPIGAAFLGALMTGALEEVLFRGLLFRLCQKLMGMWGAMAATSVLFGAAHAFNPGATLRSSVSVGLEAGLLLGAAYVWRQRLWMPIGLHAAWNFTEGPVFGMAVSGGSSASSLIQGTLVGNELLTGGDFGPENSVISVAVCLIAAAILLWKTPRPTIVAPAHLS